MSGANIKPLKLWQRIDLDIAMCIFWTITTPVAIYIFTTNNALRFLIGVPYLFFIPGYLITCIFWARKNTLSIAERISYSIGLSIVFAVLVGLILSLLIVFNLLSLLILLTTASIALSIACIIRRLKLPGTMGIDANISTVKSALKITKGAKGSIYILSTIIVFTLIVAIIVANIPQAEKKVGTTQFYVLDSYKRAIDHPINVSVSLASVLWVGLHNGEGHVIAYNILVDYVNLADNSSTNVSRYIGSLENGISLEQQINITYPHIGDFLLKITLIIDDNQVPYAILHVNVKAIS